VTVPGDTVDSENVRVQVDTLRDMDKLAVREGLDVSEEELERVDALNVPWDPVQDRVDPLTEPLVTLGE